MIVDQQVTTEHEDDWLHVKLPHGCQAYVNVRAADGGRPVIVDIHIHGPDIGYTAVQGLNLSRVRAMAVQRQHAQSKPSSLARDAIVSPGGGNAFYGDDFYRLVAQAYREYAARGRRPGLLIAAEAGVPPTTAYHWIRRARHLGFLPPGRAGRTS